jgi:hypothetical protein
MKRRTIFVGFLVLSLSSIIPLASVYSDELKGTSGKGHPVGMSDRTTSNVIRGHKENAAAVDVEGAVISGGGRPAFPNRVVGNFGAVGGGEGNGAGDRATVSGGSHNEASGFRSSIGGGSDNIARGEHATVAGGTNNSASATRTTVSGGCHNSASHLDATIGGGSGNIASFTHATVGGGTQNTASSLDATVGGGSHNMAGGAYGTVCGGSNNLASGFSAAVGGGSGNAARAGSATVGGGLGNRVSDHYGTVGGGLGNRAGNENEDLADAQYPTVAGGIDNTASGLGSTVSGGEKNQASGSFSTIPGGFGNKANGHYTFATGHRANIDAMHPGTFLYADSHDSSFDSKAANEFAVRATGGVRFVTGVDTNGDPQGGVKLEPGSGSWSSLSSSGVKANITSVEGQMVLRQLVNLPISTWSYKNQASSIRHMGPQAEDFYTTFGLGEDVRHISTIDADGVALAAIQGLHQMVKEREDQMIAQQRKIAILELETGIQRDRIADLEGRLAKIEEVIGIK